MRKTALFGFWVALGCGLTGCGGGSFTDLQAYMEEVRAQPRGRIEPMPKEVVYEPFTYKASGLRSPFQPPVKLELSTKERGRIDIKPDETRVKEFLEGFNLESFVMVGTLSDKENGYGLLRSEGSVYRVKEGDYLGRNHGRVVSVTAGAVEVVELVTDGEGGWLERPRTLILQEH